MKGTVKLFWMLTVLSATGGGILTVWALLGIGMSGAPQQAASAAIGCGLAVVPYVITRALEGLRS